MQTFTEFNLDPQILQALADLKYETTTEIQSKTLPIILAGQDVAGLSQTGTGKTAAFLIPLIQRILLAQKAVSDTEAQKAFPNWQAQQFILTVVPTRELAEQVVDNLTVLNKYTGFKSCAVYGGTGYEKQKELISKGCEFIVATPGRLMDLYKEHIIDLKQVRAVVFDEADRMFDMGFKDDMMFLLSRIPRERQFLVFSATLNFDVLNTAYQFGAEPVEVSISRDQAKAENVTDEIFHVGQDEKPAYLLSLLEKKNPKQAIVFSNFKNQVERIARFLVANNIDAEAISSLLTQASRSKVLQKFKTPQDKMCVLVATDVAARGLDIKGVDLVMNFELPLDPESYVHRIGRTGRAGETGVAYSLVSDRDVDALSRIEDYLKHKITSSWLEDSEIRKEFTAFPSEADYYENRGGFRKDQNGRGSGPRTSSPRPPRRGDAPKADGASRSRPQGAGRTPHEKGRPQSQNPVRANGAQAPKGQGARPAQNDKRPHTGKPNHNHGAKPTNGREARPGAKVSPHQQNLRRPFVPKPKTPPPPAGVLGWMKSVISKIVGPKSK